MNVKKYRQIRAIVALFVSATVSLAVTQDSMLLAAAGVLTGMLFLGLVRSKTKIVIDEREKTVREKAANMTYAIFAPTVGLGSFFLILLGQKSVYLFALGQILAYLTLFLIAVYAISYYFLNRKYGGSKDEE
jgi:uncharacterized membrane protein